MTVESNLAQCSTVVYCTVLYSHTLTVSPTETKLDITQEINKLIKIILKNVRVDLSGFETVKPSPQQKGLVDI